MKGKSDYFQHLPFAVDIDSAEPKHEGRDILASISDSPHWTTANVFHGTPQSFSTDNSDGNILVLDQPAMLRHLFTGPSTNMAKPAGREEDCTTNDKPMEPHPPDEGPATGITDVPLPDVVPDLVDRMGWYVHGLNAAVYVGDAPEQARRGARRALLLLPTTATPRPRFDVKDPIRYNTPTALENSRCVALDIIVRALQGEAQARREIQILSLRRQTDDYSTSNLSLKDQRSTREAQAKRETQILSLRRQTDDYSTSNLGGHQWLSETKANTISYCGCDIDNDLAPGVPASCPEPDSDDEDEDGEDYAQHIPLSFSGNNRTWMPKKEANPNASLDINDSCYLSTIMRAAEDFSDKAHKLLGQNWSSDQIVSKVLASAGSIPPSLHQPTAEGLDKLKASLVRSHQRRKQTVIAKHS
ncbi:hypothetical protein PRZ48_011484 [Zasmidium cellare]|uniref:Uncharacterized protein n=1 Tax=Zasmidium cellare TaxID=395010 RepID=A0ABR0E715_ZASCE|nr:hypothetical protein PRZ48_011484 [Zasmidium cellare]